MHYPFGGTMHKLQEGKDDGVQTTRINLKRSVVLRYGTNGHYPAYAAVSAARSESQVPA